MNDWVALVGSMIKIYRLAGEPFTIEPTPEARRMMDDHHNQIVERRNGDLRDVTTFAARWNEQAWRIAVVLHAGLHGEHAGERAMSGDTAASAIAIADWFAGEQLRILARGRHEAVAPSMKRYWHCWREIPARALRHGMFSALGLWRLRSRPMP